MKFGSEHTGSVALAEGRSPRPLTAVLCGSFRRDPARLRETFTALVAAYDVLSPRAIDWVDGAAEFVRLADEAALSVAEVEQAHLAAIQGADFVWLHAPDGYAGTSASMEVGFARACGVPIFTDATLTDQTLREQVVIVASPASVPAHLSPEPGSGIATLQNYYGRVALRRGWSDESPQDTLLLMTEEFGELAREVRRLNGLARSHSDAREPVALELADVQLYLVHLANALGVNLSEAVTAKERINAERESATLGDLVA